jgi:hypothetical protein
LSGQRAKPRIEAPAGGPGWDSCYHGSHTAF